MSYLEYKEVIATTASVSTILQFLSGMLVCRKFIKKGSTGEVSSFPFIAGFLSSSLWFTYGSMIRDSNIMLVNAVGISLMLIYTLTFYLYTARKNTVLKQLFAVIVVIMFLFTYFQWEENDVVAKKRIGVVACSMSIIFIAAPLSNLAHVIRVKNAESLPFPIILMAFIVSAQWFLYGVILEDPFLQYPNIAGCVLSLFQLSFFVIYPSR